MKKRQETSYRDHIITRTLPSLLFGLDSDTIHWQSLVHNRHRTRIQIQKAQIIQTQGLPCN